MEAFLQNADVSTIWPRLVFVRVSGIWMYPHFWPRLAFVSVSGMWIPNANVMTITGHFSM